MRLKLARSEAEIGLGRRLKLAESEAEIGLRRLKLAESEAEIGLRRRLKLAGSEAEIGLRRRLKIKLISTCNTRSYLSYRNEAQLRRGYNKPPYLVASAQSWS